ncbi:MAG: ATP-binding cassette domain-containing protein [Moraxella sp.]|nr:ATP-binding cassette domain-containing protein [Moraxella sp.]
MIELKNVAVRRDGRILFDKANLVLHRGQKVGLVGKNGVGKSTLFSVILGEHSVDGGEFSCPSVWHIAHMAQEVASTDTTALDYALQGDKVWYELNTKLSNQDGLTGDEIGKLHQEFDNIHGYTIPSKASQILSGLGFGQHEFDKKVGEFSGGWRMRLNLARTLMSRADVLLLDEPTNHLDLDAILWLEEWLADFDGLLIIISHDQAFLDKVVKTIVHIEYNTLTAYTANYSGFVKMRSEKLAQAQQAYDKQQATRAHLEDFIRRFRAKATKARQAQSRIKQLERMTELAPVMADSEFSFEFYEPSVMSSPLLKLENASIGYDNSPNAKPLITKVKLEITPDTRLGILGANGAGKSTLIKALVGQLPLLSGTHFVSENLRLGYFNQHQMDALDLSASPMILLRRLAGTTSDAILRSFLGSFNFKGDKIDENVLSFSGGERARLTLALIVWQRPNVLILDEPTNHLDKEMRDALMLALQNFVGAVVLVSHDRELILSVCDSLLLVGSGKAEEFVGDMNDYANHLRQARLDRQKSHKENLKKETLKSAENQSVKPSLSKEELRKKNAEIRQKTAPLRKAIEKLEKSLETLSDTLTKLENELSDTTLYEDGNKDKLLKLLEKQANLQANLVSDEEELLIKMDELEQLESELSGE